MKEKDEEEKWVDEEEQRARTDDTQTICAIFLSR